MTRALPIAAATLLTGLTPALALADESEPAAVEPAAVEPAATAPAAPALDVHAMVSLGYTYNLGRPDSNLNGLRVFDVFHNSLTLDNAELVVQVPVSQAKDVGFRIDFIAGQTVAPASSAFGLFKSVDAMGNVTAQNFDLQQGYASWIAPVGRGLRLDAGKWLSPMSAEVVEGYDGYNDNYSHTWLFGFAVPYSHTGVRATYPVSDTLTLTGAVVNGWDNALDNNSGKTAMLNGALVSGNLTFALTYCIGPEQNGNDSNLRHMVDAVAVIKAGKATVTLEGDFGHEDNAANMGADPANWFGGAGYLKLDLSPQFALTGRAEFFDDADGARTGAAQQLLGLTVTPAYKLGDGRLVLRGDVRFDHSSEDVFVSGADATANQVTIGLNVISVL